MMTQPPSQPPGGWWHPPASGQAPASGFGSQYGSHYTGFGAFELPNSAPNTHGPKRTKKPYLLVVTVFVLLAGGGVAGWLLTTQHGAVLDQASMEHEVVSVLQESYGERDVTDTSCPADQPVETDHTFNCTVVIGGDEKTVKIRVLNENPTFTVGAPH